MLLLQSSYRGASDMKVFILTLACALVGGTAGGSVAWPGAVPLSFNTYSSAILPAHTRTIAYSSSQYINAIPASHTFGYQPQFTYQLPQSSAFPSLAYQPITSAAYFPQSAFLYPQVPPISPAIPATPAFPAIPAIPASPALPAAPIPQQPANNPSGQPIQQPAGDEDSAVIESAEFSSQQQGNQQIPTSGFSSPSDSAQSDASQPQYPSQPGFPTQFQPLITPQSESSFTGMQEPESTPPQSQQPAFPQFPPFPQLPQLPQFPEFPSNPLFPQTTTPAPSSPGINGDGKGLNDEDTISVDSA